MKVIKSKHMRKLRQHLVLSRCDKPLSEIKELVAFVESAETKHSRKIRMAIVMRYPNIDVESANKMLEYIENGEFTGPNP
jgi:hypothetical protein